jgi:hypothetical protein
MSTMRLGAISLDCADPAPLGAFWAALLGGEIIVTRDDISVVKLEHVLLTAMRVENHVPPTWPDAAVPKQAHFDVAVDDLDAAEQRAVSLGATIADRQPEPASHRILLDPAGHPFCVSLVANFPT